MPFGLKNAAQAFQGLVDIVCQGFDFVFVHIDDILVARKNAKTLKGHLRLLFQQLTALSSTLPKANLAGAPLTS